MARDNQACSAGRGWTVSGVIRPVAKIAAIALAAVSGAYAILSYYSSIDALRAAVEANKLTLLIYCESNNNSDKGCEQVRDDVSSDPAVASIFDDEPSTTSEAQLSQTKPDTVNATPSPTSSPDDSVADGSSGHRAWTSFVAPTTFVTSVIQISGHGASRSSQSATQLTTSHPVPSDDYLPSDYSTWFKSCSTLETRMKAVEQRMERWSCPWPSHLPRNYDILTIQPTTKLSRSCPDLTTQFFEAKKGFKSYSCVSSPAYTHDSFSATAVVAADRPSASTTALGNPVGSDSIASSHGMSRDEIIMVVRFAVEILVIVLMIGYLIRKLPRFLETRKKNRLHQGFLRLNNDEDEKIEEISPQSPLLLYTTSDSQTTLHESPQY